jgi:hypothetical protein
MTYWKRGERHFEKMVLTGYGKWTYEENPCATERSDDQNHIHVKRLLAHGDKKGHNLFFALILIYKKVL